MELVVLLAKHQAQPMFFSEGELQCICVHYIECSAIIAVSNVFLFFLKYSYANHRIYVPLSNVTLHSEHIA